jgi:uncharacterized protein
MTDITDRSTIDDLIREKRDVILQLASRYGASNVRLFGSVARGEDRPDSDIDILISAADHVTMFDLVGLWLDLQNVLNRPVSLITDDADPRHERLLKRALQDAIPL